ncbi:alpha/beta fold hydrolase [Lentibacillus cibarius]|uniref:Alpha/beta fold hydrolase n=1 Tax=Lentibacillus cibarius TaxID=2583219 RepID=A0A5S3QG26_9BACI|nr:alpha/beta fold hydrolase [Lentibacillus cibarius]TMN20884.1 alpha/beta fold hydrolase [Lentibacillus cibarius]
MSDYLNELKDLVGLHVQSQNFNAKRIQSVMNRMESEEGDVPGSWVYEWTALGDQYLRDNKKLHAIQCYNFARFPYVNSKERKKAYRKCVNVFEQWIMEQNQVIEKRNIRFGEEKIPVYASGFDRKKRPLLIVIGGIVSIKEQWYKFLLECPRLGFFVVVAECPGVGENPLTYDEQSQHMIGAILNAFADCADVDQTYFVGMSFGGHLGIKYSLQDDRIRGITTVGAPVNHFYTNDRWFENVPDTTKNTLAHLCQVNTDCLFHTIRSFAIDNKEIKRLKIPLHYIFSERDEIIPSSEKQYLKRNVSQLELIEFDDVHGSPHHMGEIQKYIPLSVMRQQKSKMLFFKWTLRWLLTVEIVKRKVRTLNKEWVNWKEKKDV